MELEFPGQLDSLDKFALGNIQGNTESVERQGDLALHAGHVGQRWRDQMEQLIARLGRQLPFFEQGARRQRQHPPLLGGLDPELQVKIVNR
jgi:hypothetical protein